MKNLLKRNSRKVNVSNCGTLDCYEKQTEKEVEIYKPISEDIIPNKDKNLIRDNKEEYTPKSSEENVADLKEINSSTDTKMVQEENNVNDGADEQMLGAEDNEKLAVKRDEVKFIKGDHQNGDAKIDIGAINGKAFTGMTKEELMKYANDPFWVRLRWIFFISFWLIWLGMLIGAILIIVDAPKCAAPEPLAWYKRGVLAQFPSFELTDGNVDSAKKIKATGAIYELPAEHTYNIHDQEVEEKIKDIVKRYKESGIHVILDITPNYVQKTSRLVQDALKDETKRSAFVWTEKAEVPNNWIGLNDRPAWYEITSGNYVLSRFGDGLYDLNMNDTIVKKELSDVLQHAIQLGVRGIRFKNSHTFIVSKNLDLKSETVAVGAIQYDLSQYGFWTHSETVFQEGLGDVLYDYLTVVKNASADAFLSVADDVIRPEIYKRNNSSDYGIDIPIYGHFVRSLSKPKDRNLSSELINVMKAVDNKWLQWNLADVGNDTQVGPSAMFTFLSLLPGTPVLPMGNEAYVNLSEKSYKKIEELRSTPSCMHGDFATLPADPLVAFTRLKSGSPGYLVVFNPTDVNQHCNFTNPSLPDKMSVLTFSDNYNDTTIGSRIDPTDFELPPLSTIVLSFVPVKKE